MSPNSGVALTAAPDLVAIRRSPSFSELAGRIDAADLTAVTKRDLKSALKRVAGWLGETPENVPADAAWLHLRMTDWTGARFGVSAATYTVVLSQLRRALRFCAPPQKVAAMALGPQWQPLADTLSEYWIEYRKAQGCAPGQNWLAIRLGRFMQWCETAGIAPDAVDDGVIAAYIDAVAATALRGDIAEKERGLRKAWNHCRLNIAGWPATPVATRRTPSAHPDVSLPEDHFPASFIAELDAYEEHRGFLRRREIEDRSLSHLERLRRHHPILHEDGTVVAGRRRPLRPLARPSLYWHRRVMVMTASALVAQGVKPIEAIQGIADVATPEGAACVIDCYDARRPAGDPTTYPSQLVTALLSIISRCGIVLPAADRSALNELAGEVAAEAGRDDTISPKNRKRLAQFDDPDAFALLISCSEQEMDRLEAERRARGRISIAMARRAEAAIGNLLLCSLPVRRRTLVTTDWERNFRKPTRGGPATLVYHPDQTKTRRALQVVLDPWRWRSVELYWHHYRRHLAGADRSSFLFPGETAAGHKTFGKLANAVTQFVQRRTGLEMNLHLWRHLMGAKLLEEHEDIRLVEELLGHVPGSRATRRYVELKCAWAAKRLDRITDGVRERGRHLHRRLERRADRRRVAP